MINKTSILNPKIFLCLALILGGCATNMPAYPIPEAAFSAGPGIYTVQPGDSKAEIAKNLCLSMKQLSDFNPGVDWSRLKVGQKLYYAPPISGLTGRISAIQLKFVTADSEETKGENGRGENAVDGDPKTFWDTQWQGKNPGLPHEIIIELIPPSVIKGFTYLPRQDDSDHGTVKDYEFYVSDDGKDFGSAVKQGAFASGKEEQSETFAPVKCRYIKLRALSEINGLAWTSAAEIGVISGDANTDLMTNQVDHAARLLAEFERDKSIDQLESAFRAVERVSPPGFDKTVPLAVARRQQAELWLNLLATIDQNIDPNFDVNNPTNWAAINLIPPGVDGMRYPSGVDPNDIKEPEVRTQYEAALKANAEKGARELFQTRLRNIDRLAGIDVSRFFPAYYKSSEADQAELADLMAQANLSSDRSEKIKALFESTNSASMDVDDNFTKKISNSLLECQKIKPGMTRADLLKTFTIEGGLFTARHRTFVYHRCPYIKLDVDFTASDPDQSALEERPTDVINHVSKPYLDWSVSD